MSLEQSILYDSIIYICVNIYIILWVLSKKINKIDKLIYIIFFIILNSSYNIMIKPVHDYNLSIARTFIWRYKIIASMSSMDIIFTILFLLNIINIFKQFKRSSLTRLIYMREFIVILIGTASFIINKGYQVDSGSQFFIETKTIVYFFASYALFSRYFNHTIQEVDYVHIFKVILISGFISLMFFDKDFLWERYGQFVKIIDQEDAGTISIFVVGFTAIKFIKTKKIKDAFICLVFFLQNALCIYKANIIYLIFGITVYLILFNKKSSRKVAKIVLAVNGFVLMILVFFRNIIQMVTSQAIYTRIFQTIDFVNDMKNRGIYAILFGLGIGTPYVSNFNIGDNGEIKAIDRMKDIYLGYRFSVQVPILGIIKYIGFFGFVIYLTITMIIFIKTVKVIKKSIKLGFDTAEYKTIAIILLYVICFGNSLSLGGACPVNVFNAFIITRIIYINNNFSRRIA